MEDKDIKELTKWSTIISITHFIFALTAIGANLVIILRELTDFKYSKVFAYILIAIFVVLIPLDIVCHVKTRKYKKMLEKLDDDEIAKLEEGESDALQ